MSSKTVKLNDGRSMPMIGLGTSYVTHSVSPPIQSDGVESYEAIVFAIKNGYRSIDTAKFYKNEKEIGDAIQYCIKEKICKREDLFITTKLWCTDNRASDVKKAIQTSLKLLQLDYLDLYLVHWPITLKAGTEDTPIEETDSSFFDTSNLEETWKAMEGICKLGLAKSIGISNFNISQMSRILKMCQIKPAVHQIEVHADLPNKEIVQFSKESGMVVTAYSPLSAPHFHTDTPLLARDCVLKIADKHNKSASQVLINYLMQRGLTVIPKSVKPHRILENFNVFDFKITEDDIAVLEAAATNRRVIHMDFWAEHPEYPF